MKRYSVIVLIALLLVSTAYAQDSQSLLDFEFISQIPDPVEPGKYVDLRWRVENQGGKTQDYIFELRPEYPFLIDETTTPLMIKRTVEGFQGGDETLTLYYRVRVADDAVEGTSNDITLAYRRDAASSQEITIEQPIRIESREGLVTISDVTLMPEQINVGSQFTVKLELQNYGTTTISNVIVTLDTEDTGFTPTRGSNQKIVNLLPGSAVKSLSFDYFADGDTAVKVHSIPVTVEYTDNLGRSNEISTKIGFLVDAKPTYLYNLENWEVYTPSTKGNIVASISNVGKSDINFVVLELVETDDYTVLSTPKSYLGNLESDDFETGQFEIFVNEGADGEIPLIFHLFYRDEYDKNYEDTITIPHRIYSVEEAQKLGLIPKPSYVGYIVFAVLLIGAVLWYVFGKKKKQ